MDYAALCRSAAELIKNDLSIIPDPELRKIMVDWFVLSAYKSEAGTYVASPSDPGIRAARYLLLEKGR